MLALASALIVLLPFRRIAALAAGTQGLDRPLIPPEEGQWISRAIGAWAALVPWRAVCFQQGLAALLMLRRRRQQATLFYGAAHGADGALVAHVWVRSGNQDVIGCAQAANYGVLAAFPAEAG